MRLWLIILIIGILSFALRLSFIALFSRYDVPKAMQRALRYVPVAVLPALIFPAFFMPQAVLDISIGNERLLAGILAGIVAWRTSNVLMTITAGMATLWCIQAVT